jgi:SAM-dependent methyltransferase
MRSALALVSYVVVGVYLAIQVRKPGRWVGRPFVWLMNVTHASVTDWGLTHVEIAPRFTILDVGCGGGKTIEKLAALANEGLVFGVDYADGSVAESRRRNAELIEQRRADIRQASVSSLPFPDDTFDLVTAIETHYYWPNIARDLEEIRRVLKPGGRVLIVAESYSGGRFQHVQQAVLKPLGSTLMTLDQHREWLTAAGFSDVQIDENRKKSWMSASGRKSA